jgi:hypothetical protein
MRTLCAQRCSTTRNSAVDFGVLSHRVSRIHAHSRSDTRTTTNKTAVHAFDTRCTVTSIKAPYTLSCFDTLFDAWLYTAQEGERRGAQLRLHSK